MLRKPRVLDDVNVAGTEPPALPAPGFILAYFHF